MKISCFQLRVYDGSVLFLREKNDFDVNIVVSLSLLLFEHNMH